MPAPKITRPAQAMADAPLGQAHARHVAIRTKPILFTHPFEDRPDNRGQFGAMRQFKCRSELGQNIAELESRGHPGRMKVRERVHAFNARHTGISCEQLQTTKRIPLVAFGVRVA